MILPSNNIQEAMEKVALSSDLKRRAAQKAMERAAMLEKAWIKRTTKAKNPAQSELSYTMDGHAVQNAAARRRAQRRLFAGEGRPGDVMGRNPRGIYGRAGETKAIEKGLLAKPTSPTPSSPAPAKGVSNLALGGGALAAAGAGYGLAKMSHVYGGNNIQEAMEKVASKKAVPGLLNKWFRKTPRSAGFQKSKADAIARNSRNVPGTPPKRTVLEQLEVFGLNTTRGARPSASAAGWRKTANVQMIKMYLRQGLSPAAAVKRAYPGWSAARRAALVRRLRG